MFGWSCAVSSKNVSWIIVNCFCRLCDNVLVFFHRYRTILSLLEWMLLVRQQLVVLVNTSLNGLLAASRASIYGLLMFNDSSIYITIINFWQIEFAKHLVRISCFCFYFQFTSIILVQLNSYWLPIPHHISDMVLESYKELNAPPRMAEDEVALP